MKKFIFLFSALFFLAFSIDARAELSFQEKSGSINYRANVGTSYYHDYRGFIDGKFYLYIDKMLSGAGGSYYSVQLVNFGESSVKINLDCTDYNFADGSIRGTSTKTFDLAPYTLSDLKQQIDGERQGNIGSAITIRVSPDDDSLPDIETDFPLFASADALYRWFANGDDSGWLNMPIDLSGSPTFSMNDFDTSIPKPLVSNVTFNSFKLKNYSDDYYIQVAYDMSIYNLYVPDSALNSPIYDVIDTDGAMDELLKSPYRALPNYNKVYKNLKVDFNKLPTAIKPTVFSGTVGNRLLPFFDADKYHTDNYQWLYDNLSEFMRKYNSISKIDGYTTAKYKCQLPLFYFYFSQFSDLGAVNDGATLKNLIETDKKYPSNIRITWYVRYVTSDMKKSPWTITTIGFDGSQNYNDINIPNKVITDSELTDVIDDIPITKPITQTTVDNNNNIIDYTPTVNMDLNMNSFDSSLNSLSSSIGTLPTLIAAVFQFLPWWVVPMIVTFLSIVVICRVIGR